MGEIAALLLRGEIAQVHGSGVAALAMSAHYQITREPPMHDFSFGGPARQALRRSFTR
jgi:hypothetical protein